MTQANKPTQPELLPCPFDHAGNQSEAVIGIYRNDLDTHWCACNICGTKGPLAVNIALAIKAWNTRTSTAAVMREVLEEVMIEFKKEYTEGVGALSRHDMMSFQEFYSFLEHHVNAVIAKRMQQV